MESRNQAQRIYYILKKMINNPESLIAGIASEVEDMEAYLASEIACLDEEIEVHMQEYNACRSDLRTLFYEDIVALVARRQTLLDELNQTVEDAAQALDLLQLLINACRDKVDEVQNSIPEPLDVNIQEPESVDID